jgi:hypothetical protein
MPSCLKIGFGSFGQEHFPCAAEVGAGLSKVAAVPARALARIAARIESAAPFPRRRVPRISRAYLDCADLNIAKIDQPAIVVGFVTAAGEGGHGTIKAAPKIEAQIINP